MIHGTVFIVEDEPELLQLLKLRIESAGYRVESTSQGDEAYDLICAAMPDVVILDIFLPEIDGLTILKKLKCPVDIETGKPSLTKDIPVLVITGKAPMIENMTRLEGASDFFVKPIDNERLLKRIFQVLEMEHVRKNSA